MERRWHSHLLYTLSSRGRTARDGPRFLPASLRAQDWNAESAGYVRAGKRISSHRGDAPRNTQGWALRSGLGCEWRRRAIRALLAGSFRRLEAGHTLRG